jgi:nucleoside-diphosphate-sugar epimerase
MKILITGAFGSAGRAVVRELEPHHELVLFDRQPFNEPLKHQHGYVLSPLKTDWPVYTATVADVDVVRQAMVGVDAVVHLAGHLSTPSEETVEIFRDNAYGTFVILDAAARSRARRVLIASSIVSQIPYAAEGRGGYIPSKLPITEEDEQAPEDAYSLSKRTAEEICAAFHLYYGLTTAALRFTWLFPDEMYQQRIDMAEPVTAWEEQLFSWIHVDDVARAIRLAIEVPSLPGYGSYLLSAEDTWVPEPSIEVIRRFRPELLDRIVGSLEGRSSLVSCAKARDTFGFRPSIRFPW